MLLASVAFVSFEYIRNVFSSLKTYLINVTCFEKDIVKFYSALMVTTMSLAKIYYALLATHNIPIASLSRLLSALLTLLLA